MCVAFIARMAVVMGWRVGMARHEGEWEDDWRWIVYIDLPAGQVSWHIHDSEREWFNLPDYPGVWDGHTTEEKYARLGKVLPLTRNSGDLGNTRASGPPPGDGSPPQ